MSKLQVLITFWDDISSDFDVPAVSLAFEMLCIAAKHLQNEQKRKKAKRKAAEKDEKGRGKENVEKCYKIYHEISTLKEEIVKNQVML